MNRLDKAECLEWAFGDLIANSTRGRVAEFIVAKALDLTGERGLGWDSADLYYRGVAVEVKSSAYVQAWQQTKPSQIKFDIAGRRFPWDARTNTMRELEQPERAADLYVFCVLKERDRDLVDPLVTDQWGFYVVPRTLIDERLGTQQGAGLSTIRSLAAELPFEKIRAEVDRVLLESDMQSGS